MVVTPVRILAVQSARTFSGRSFLVSVRCMGGGCENHCSESQVSVRICILHSYIFVTGDVKVLTDRTNGIIGLYCHASALFVIFTKS